MEVPVVATRIAGVPRLVGHEVNGLLIEPGDTAQIGGGIRRILQDAALRDRLRRAARETIENRYSFENRMARIRAIYEYCSKQTVRKPGSEEGRLTDAVFTSWEYDERIR